MRGTQHFLKVSKNGEESGLWPFLIESVPVEHAADIGKSIALAWPYIGDRVLES
jgi:hypothetical protein